MEAFDIILPIVYIVVGIALVWFVIELAITIRKVRGKAMDTIDDIQPTLKNLEGMVADIQPTVKKVDPLVDRVTLTIDSVNLEMMRVDEILEDVSNMTGTISKTLTTVDSVTSAPVDIVTSVTRKVRDKFRPKFASDESAKMGLGDAPQQNPFAEFADTAIDAAGEAFKEHHDKSQALKDERDVKAAERSEKNERIGDESVRLADAVLDQANQDAPEHADDQPSDELEEAVATFEDEGKEQAKPDASDIDVPLSAEDAAKVFELAEKE